MDCIGSEFTYETAFELLVRLEADELFLNTCLPNINKVLELHPGKCYELDGDTGVGKTQVLNSELAIKTMGLQICYSIAAKFLQTKKTARIGWISAVPLRTDHLCKHFKTGECSDRLLDRIACKRVEYISELRESLDHFSKTFNTHLVVVENIDALLHDTAYENEIGRNVQTDIIERLKKLTRLGVTVIITNHITHWRGYPAPALGMYWASQIANRFYVEKLSGDVRTVSVMKEGEDGATRANFSIDEKGLKAAN
ncbi:hypothetical protein GCK72_009777 [Caenorhabditis remanei]|uniref:RecA family profile 1 domain-containing protein n=1 Tax=Caenorhabditis remanei TaxID=31234 RepID=A0A6A5H3E4_CAERE|nr:hypothetical protein GCK72_009777 [Caenorhabditis remanei]KAF1761521.1 hypothetical protein GCK72_009777 [Caenorhabditis remanei]